MSNDFKITLLKGKDNYAIWLIDIRAILRSKNYWNSSLSNGDAEVATAAAAQLQQAKQAYATPPATPATQAATLSASPPNHAVIERRVRREWQTSSEKAADIITLTLHADVKAKLLEEDFNDAFKMMTHLKQLYEPSTDTEFFMLMRELLSLRHADFNTTEHYLSHLRSLNDRITRTKVDLTPEKRALLTLTMSLPSEFEPLIQVWSLQPTPPTFDEASRQLMEHQRRHSQDQGVSRLSPSHLTMSSLTYSLCKVCSKRHDPAVCCKCPSAKKPHPVERCWKLHPELRPEWVKSREASATATANVAIADDAGISFGAPRGNAPTWGTSFHF
jgi:hypothetical protein